jgi:hypothetical protein
MTLIPPTSAAELVGSAPFAKKREETIVWLLLDMFRARWKEFMATTYNFFMLALVVGWLMNYGT